MFGQFLDLMTPIAYKPKLTIWGCWSLLSEALKISRTSWVKEETQEVMNLKFTLAGWEKTYRIIFWQFASLFLSDYDYNNDINTK